MFYMCGTYTLCTCIFSDSHRVLTDHKFPQICVMDFKNL